MLTYHLMILDFVSGLPQPEKETLINWLQKNRKGRDLDSVYGVPYKGFKAALEEYISNRTPLVPPLHKRTKSKRPMNEEPDSELLSIS